MAVTQEVVYTELVDTAVGPVSVTKTKVTGFDIDDYVTTTVQSLATAIQLYNMASVADTQFTKNRNPVNIGGVAVGGY